MCDGRRFQADGAATEKELLESWRLNRGTIKSPRDVDRSIVIELKLVALMWWSSGYTRAHFPSSNQRDCWCANCGMEESPQADSEADLAAMVAMAAMRKLWKFDLQSCKSKLLGSFGGFCLLTPPGALHLDFAGRLLPQLCPHHARPSYATAHIRPIYISLANFMFACTYSGRNASVTDAYISVMIL